jgi:hypothetical protein
MGSYEAIADFFPTFLDAHDWLFPGRIAALLPPGHERAVELGGGALRVRTPLLVPLAALGVLVGVRGYVKLRGGGSNTAAWALAFLYFAAMNAAGIVCHCLAPRGSPLARLTTGLDVAFTGLRRVRWRGGISREPIRFHPTRPTHPNQPTNTNPPGCSSACLIIASLAGSAKPGSQPRPAAAGLAARLWLPVCAVAVAGNVLFPAARAGLNELIYLATTAAAALVLFANEVLRTPPSAPGGWAVRAAGAAAGVMGVGVHIDAPLAAASGGWVTATHAVFLGCDLAFLALGCYLAAKDKEGGRGGGAAATTRATRAAARKLA